MRALAIVISKIFWYRLQIAIVPLVRIRCMSAEAAVFSMEVFNCESVLLCSVDEPDFGSGGSPLLGGGIGMYVPRSLTSSFARLNFQCADFTIRNGGMNALAM